MKTWSLFPRSFLQVAAFLLAASCGLAQTMTVVPSTTRYDPVAGSVTFTVTVTYPGTLTAIGVQVLLPTGWTYASASGAEGDTKPSVGTSGLLEWAWNSVPASPVTYSFTLNYPAGQSGNQVFSSLLVYRAGGAAQNVSAADVTLTARIFHSADTSRDGAFGLSELLRVIQIYNYRAGTVRTGQYGAQAGTEDGFAPGPGSGGPYHSADSNLDGRISLLELTRVMQLFNSRVGTVRLGQYHDQSGTEDGFAPGL